VALLEARGGELAVAPACALGVGEVAVLGMRDLLDRFADELALGVAEDLGQAPVELQKAPAEIDVRDARAGELESLAKARLRGAQRLLGVSLGGDVGAGGDDPVTGGRARAARG